MNLIKYDTLKNTQVGKISFVCGAGLSFGNIISSKYFDRINDNIVISVNSSIVALDWSSEVNSDKRYWISNDSAVRTWDYWKKVKASKCYKIIRDSWNKYYSELDGFYVFSPRKNNKMIEESGLVSCSSVPTAIDFALQLGCKKIYLLGIDHFFNGTKSYFWQLWPLDKQPRTSKVVAPQPLQKSVFEINIPVFRLLNDFAKLKNAEIYNCSMNSKVDVFPKVNFEDIWD